MKTKFTPQKLGTGIGASTFTKQKVVVDLTDTAMASMDQIRIGAERRRRDALGQGMGATYDPGTIARQLAAAHSTLEVSDGVEFGFIIKLGDAGPTLVPVGLRLV